MAQCHFGIGFFVFLGIVYNTVAMPRKNRKKQKTKNAPLKLAIPVFAAAVISLFFFNLSGASDEDVGERIESLRNRIEKYQDEIYELGQREESLEREVLILEKDIEKIELQLEETRLRIASLSGEISAKEKEIGEIKKEISAKEQMLAQFLQELYENGQASTIEIILGNEKFTDYFSLIEGLETYEDKTREAYDQLVFLRTGLESERKFLIEGREEQYELQMIQQDQERSLEYRRNFKNSLLSQTVGEKELLAKKTDKLRAELSMLQSLGEPINLKEAVEAAKFASKLTDVAPEFLLGMLRIESGLGTNVGGGRYKKDMNPGQWDAFKKICKELKLDPDDTPVSRRICYNKNSSDGCGGWGGAMGPAQFMPSTWMGYKEKVEKLAGRKTANPWDLEDSLVAMGLKLAAVDGVAKGKRKAWAKAAGIYLAGANWENYSWYSDKALFYADEYKKILKDY